MSGDPIEKLRRIAEQPSVSVAVAARLGEWGEVVELDVAVSAIALRLAVLLDSGVCQSPAAVARELRLTLNQLEPRNDPSGDADIRFLNGLRAPVGHPSEG